MKLPLIGRPTVASAMIALAMIALALFVSLAVLAVWRSRKRVDESGPSQAAHQAAELSALPASTQSPDRSTEGHALLQLHECVRCHRMAEPVPEDRDPDERSVSFGQHCTHCHQAIADGEYPTPSSPVSPEELDHWREHVRGLTSIPSLENLGAIRRRDFVVSYLQRPKNLRNNTRYRMPHFGFSQEQAQALADALQVHLNSEDLETFEPNKRAQGQALFANRHCTSCHAADDLPNNSLDVQQSARQQSPTLCNLSERMTADQLRAWLHNPKAIRPQTLMPNPNLEEGEIEALGAYLFSWSCETTQHEQSVAAVERHVGYEEVRAIFSTRCPHCHSNPAYGRREGGAGNTGGFGFRGVGLDLSSYEAIRSGLVREDRSRHSILTRENGPSLLERALLARVREEQGLPTDIHGMPMGLAPLSAEELRIVERWVDEGAPNQ